MKYWQHILFLCFFLGGGLPLTLVAQELNLQVIINSERARTQEKEVFEDMKVTFEQFLNNRNWTNEDFLPHERIKGNVLITINDMPQVGFYNATVQIQAVRPVHGTNYESMYLNFIDRNWSFEYLQNQPLEFNRFSFLNNISSLLSYYAYIILGLDADTFALRGGDPYFEIANNIVNNAQQSNRAGWGASGSDRRNRYWLTNDIYISSVYGPIREALYLYHRRGMDLLGTRQEEAFINMLEAIKKVADANDAQPNSIFTIAFMDAKGEEIAKIFRLASPEIRAEAVKALLRVDPNNAKRYNELLKG
ncbi:hypothetical protein A3SI_11804 [Nitritalea halalkaliphila LW7]|uniref:DUF4835 domain-containing protein n=1 Tax=Nitritalea halalkaliphila LW7 TaxID=1189621 RepID=I5C2I8_9BACT|nr:DUF4835 family protein [Nitritalea halalkaliphila]EIM76040.1 hypothetical protein A3SI_11804 [Nitritalea halalkaliphila LW7]